MQTVASAGGLKGIIGSAGSAFGGSTWGGIGHNIGTMFGGNRSTDSAGGTWATIGNQSINTDTFGGKISALSQGVQQQVPPRWRERLPQGGIALTPEAGLLGERPRNLGRRGGGHCRRLPSLPGPLARQWASVSAWAKCWRASKAPDNKSNPPRQGTPTASTSIRQMARQIVADR